MKKYFHIFVATLVVVLFVASITGNSVIAGQPVRPTDDPCIKLGTCGPGDHGNGNPKLGAGNPNSWSKGEVDGVYTPTPAPQATATARVQVFSVTSTPVASSTSTQSGYINTSTPKPVDPLSTCTPTPVDVQIPVTGQVPCDLCSLVQTQTVLDYERNELLKKIATSVAKP